MRFDDFDNPLALEIKQEIASSYFTACQKMVNALEALKAFDLSRDRYSSQSQAMTRRVELLENAAERVYFVIIQREAMNFPHYEPFFENYEIPDEVRQRLGPRRR